MGVHAPPLSVQGRAVRYAILSDLHANWQAWRALHADAVALRCDRIIVLGDIVGYGPRPAEVMSAVHAQAFCWVLGNHDAVVGQRLPAEGFNRDARQAIEWTRAQLSSRAVRLFGKAPLMVAGESFRCVHGSPHAPEHFPYIRTEEDARRAWEACGESLVFVGHTHLPCVHRLDENGAYRCARSRGFEVRSGRRYVVNVGSAGMPRDADFRASYCLFDEASGRVRFRRVAYDVDALRKELQARCRVGRQAQHVIGIFDAQAGQPRREQIDFAPERSGALEPGVREERLSAARRQARRWRTATVLVAGLLVVGSAVGAFVWQRMPAAQRLSGPRRETTLLDTSGTEVGLVLLPDPLVVGQESIVPPGWLVELANGRLQSVGWDRAGVTVQSKGRPERVALCSPWVRIGAQHHRVRLRLAGQFSAGNMLGQETPLVLVDFRTDDGRVSQAVRSRPVVIRGMRCKLQYTFDVWRNAEAVRIRVVARLCGVLRVSLLSLEPQGDTGF